MDYTSLSFWLSLCNNRIFLSFNKTCSASLPMFSPKSQDTLDFPLRYLRIVSWLPLLLFSGTVFLFCFLFILLFILYEMAKDSAVTDRVGRKEEERPFWRVIWITQLTCHRVSKAYFELVRSLNHYLTCLWYVWEWGTLTVPAVRGGRLWTQ